MELKSSLEIEELCLALERELSGRRGFVNNRVNIDECCRIFSEIRKKIAPYIDSANSVYAGRGAILANADGVAKNVLRIAEEKAAHLVGNSEIVKNAEIAGRKIIDEAYARCDDLVLKTKKSLDDVLCKAETVLRETLSAISAYRYAVKSMIIEAET